MRILLPSGFAVFQAGQPLRNAAADGGRYINAYLTHLQRAGCAAASKMAI